MFDEKRIEDDSNNNIDKQNINNGNNRNDDDEDDINAGDDDDHCHNLMISDEANNCNDEKQDFKLQNSNELEDNSHNDNDDNNTNISTTTTTNNINNHDTPEQEDDLNFMLTYENPIETKDHDINFTNDTLEITPTQLDLMDHNMDDVNIEEQYHFKEYEDQLQLLMDDDGDEDNEMENMDSCSSETTGTTVISNAYCLSPNSAQLNNTQSSTTARLLFSNSSAATALGDATDDFEFNDDFLDNL